MSELMKVATEVVLLEEAHTQAEREERAAEAKCRDAFSALQEKGKELCKLALDDEDDSKKLVLVPDDKITSIKIIEIDRHGAYVYNADNPEKEHE